jgi:hypothetical protein
MGIKVQDPDFHHVTSASFRVREEASHIPLMPEAGRSRLKPQQESWT